MHKPPLTRNEKRCKRDERSDYHKALIEKRRVTPEFNRPLPPLNQDKVKRSREI
jgi:hypothetical protein